MDVRGVILVGGRKGVACDEGSGGVEGKSRPASQDLEDCKAEREREGERTSII